MITRNAWIDAISAPAIAATTSPAASETPLADVEALHAPEAHHRPDEHHPLDAEVEHARALGQQLAERGVEERRPVGDAGGDHDHEEAVVHSGDEQHQAGSTSAVGAAVLSSRTTRSR